MRVKTTMAAAVMGVLVMTLGASGKDHQAKPSQLDNLARLAGDWAGTAIESGGAGEKEVTVSYKVTAGGSMVLETEGPGTPHEMVTAYYVDGDDLVMTHYCMLHNQPHMKAERGGDNKKLVFKFAGGSNIKPDSDMHMHDMTLELIDADHIKSTWTMYEGGKDKGTVVMDLKRKS